MNQRTPRRTSYLSATTVAVLTTLFLVYAVGALGIVGAGGRADLMYLAALGLGLVVAVGHRLRPRGLAVGMATASVGTLVAGAVAVVAGLHREEGASVLEILGLSAMFATLWAVAAWLYSRASAEAVTN